jgi:REP element-mobilizing transposase RayT
MAIGVTNHLHLIASATDEGNLSDILRDFKKFTSKAIIDAIKEDPESRIKMFGLQIRTSGGCHLIIFQ